MTGYELDIEAETAGEPASEQGEAKPVTQKLKKKTELEDSLLKAIEEHGE